MGKVPRVDVAGLIYHAWNRGNAGGKIFYTDKDYEAFEEIVSQAVDKTKMGLLAYCVMPNHWHFVLQPKNDGDLSRFFHWLTVTHATRWHSLRGTEGAGHLYQGRYKSNVCESDKHYLQLVRYVERNALRAGLVQRAEEWKWSSSWVRVNGNERQKQLLSEWPVVEPSDYQMFLNNPQNEEELEVIRNSLKRGAPYGSGQWRDEMIVEHSLESTIRKRGRPFKGTRSL